ncbi:MAG: HAD-IIA family hydrolase [Promethearchaeota archaeon]
MIDALKDIKLAIFDLDGVIYRGKELIPNADLALKELKNQGIKIAFNSNNSTETREMYVEKLKKFSIDANVSEIYTSAFIAAKIISQIKRNANIYVIGEIGLIEELKSVGLDRNFHYDKLAFAQKCILQGKARFFATNTDSTLPVPGGLLPGAGVMVNALTTCTGKQPEQIFGKPEPIGIKIILKNFNVKPKNAIIFGDRLNTDILAGNRASIKTALVLTGVTSREDLSNLKNEEFFDKQLLPDFIFESLMDIF